MSRRRRSQTASPGPLRVGFLTPGLGIGGAERWVLTLAKSFEPSRVHVAGIWTPDTTGPLAQEAKLICPVRHIQAEAQCLHACDALIAWGCDRLAQDTHGFAGRIIAVSHGSPDLEFTRCICAAMEAVPNVELTAVSAATAAIWHHPSTILWNGVDPGRCAPRRSRDAVRRQLGLPPQQRVALFFGRLSEEKRPRLLAEACALSGDWMAVFCGPDSGSRGSLLGLPHTLILPPRAEPGDLLAAADAFVLPSATEGFPLAVIEAWMAGTPVICTDLPWLASVEQTLGLALAHKVPAAATAAEWARALDSPQSPHVTAARNAAWQHFTAGAMAQRWEDYLLPWEIDI